MILIQIRRYNVCTTKSRMLNIVIGLFPKPVGDSWVERIKCAMNDYLGVKNIVVYHYLLSNRADCVIYQQGYRSLSLIH